MDIQTCAHLDENWADLRNFGGLALLQGVSAWCHYQKEDDQMIESFIDQYAHPVLVLSEDTGAILDDQKVHLQPVFLLEIEKSLSGQAEREI